MTTVSHCLIRHPGAHTPDLDALRVDVRVAADGALELAYHLLGDLARLRIPPRRAADRSDELWRHTCCEAFVAGAETPAYREFNFSPSGQWQAYDFAAYRQPLPRIDLPAPILQRDTRVGAFRMRVRLARQCLPNTRRMRVGLSAVIEAADGALSYWALRHASERPDFHHADSFALRIDLP